MDPAITASIIAFLFAVGAAVIFFSNEHTAFKETKAHLEMVRAQNIQLTKKDLELEKTVNDLRTAIVNQKTEVDQVQEHCAAIREQQQRLNRNQKILRDKIKPAPQELKIEIIDKPRAEKSKPPILPRGNAKDVKHEGPVGISSYAKMKEITQQLKDLAT